MAEASAADGITERTGFSALTLRLHAPTAQHIAQVGAALGLELPLQPNIVLGHALQAWWTAPGEWLLTGEPAASLRVRVHSACAGMIFHLADLSDALAVFELGGAAAGARLARICSLDLHEAVFKSGQCAQSLFAQVRGAVRQLDDRPTYQLLIDRSYAAHLRQCLTEVGGAFGAATERPLKS